MASVTAFVLTSGLRAAQGHAIMVDIHGQRAFPQHRTSGISEEHAKDRHEFRCHFFSCKALSIDPPI